MNMRLDVGIFSNHLIPLQGQDAVERRK